MQYLLGSNLPVVKFKTGKGTLLYFRLYKDKILGLSKDLAKIKVMERDNDEETSDEEIDYQLTECQSKLSKAIEQYNKKMSKVKVYTKNK